jgi:hypothetical protein
LLIGTRTWSLKGGARVCYHSERRWYTIRVSDNTVLKKSEGGCDVGSRGRELNGVDIVESLKNKSSKYDGRQWNGASDGNMMVDMEKEKKASDEGALNNSIWLN